MVRKDVIKNDTTTNANKLFVLRRRARSFTEDISSREDQSFEEIPDRLKTFEKSTKVNENFSLKGKTLVSGWLSTAARI